MADVLTKEQRHKNMTRIRAKDTKPEIVLRKALWKRGYRYRKNRKNLPGKPDIVLTDIRCKSMWAQNDRETLRELLLAREQSASMERTKALQAEVNAISKRLPELDKLIMSAYEDKVLGRVPESVCIQLLNQYEAERREN